MPEFYSHIQGIPSWVELSTTDDQAALAFYGALFGWVDDPQEMGPGMYYHMQKLRGLEVAAMYQQGDEEQQQGVPPHWKTYFTVDDIAKTTEQANESGATVMFGPIEVFDAGHAAVLQDPQGAVFALWHGKNHIGVRVKDETGAIMWTELLTNAAEDATKFYSDLLGMSSSKMPGPVDYTMLKVGGTDVAGVMAITDEMGPVPPHWRWCTSASTMSTMPPVKLSPWVVRSWSHRRISRISAGSPDSRTFRARCSSYLNPQSSHNTKL